MDGYELILGGLFGTAYGDALGGTLKEESSDRDSLGVVEFTGVSM